MAQRRKNGNPIRPEERAKKRKRENAKSDRAGGTGCDRIASGSYPLRAFAFSRFRALFGPFPIGGQRALNRLLLACLLGLGILYLALLPSLRRMAGETQRLQ